MAINSKKTAYALFSLVEDGHDPIKVSEAFWNYAQSSNVLYVVPNVIRHLELLSERKKKEKMLSIASPYPISQEVKESIAKLMNASSDEDTEIKINKKLIGGFVVKYNNSVYDASIKTQLETLKKELTSN